MDSIICIDYGSQTIKGGLATNIPTEEDPRVVTPSAVGVPTLDGSADIQHPIQQGTIKDDHQFERLLNYVIYDLLDRPYGGEGSAVIAEPLFAPKRDRELITQLMFEVFNVSGLCMQDQASLALYSIGKLQGAVVDLGHGKLDVAAISDGQVQTTSMRRLPFSGELLTRYMQSLMAQRGVALTLQQAEALKEQCCTASVTLANERSEESGAAAAAETSYTLPDGQSVQVTVQIVLACICLRSFAKAFECHD